MPCRELPTQAYPAGGGIAERCAVKLGMPSHMINTASGEGGFVCYHPDYAHATFDEDKNAATPEIPWPDVYKRYAHSDTPGR